MTRQRFALGSNEMATVPSRATDVLRSPAHTLASHTRVFAEPRYGHDFSKVRIHADNTPGAWGTARADASNEALPQAVTAPARPAGGLPPAVLQRNVDASILQRQGNPPGGPKPAPGGALATGVHDIDIKTISKPTQTVSKPDPEHPGSLKVTTDSPLTVDAGALIPAGEDCRSISFGWVQLCRPYYLYRAIYHSMSGGDDVEVNASANIRAKMPVLDVANTGDTFYFRLPVVCAEPGADKSASAHLSDKPESFFKIAFDSDHILGGVAYQAFFFDTLTMTKAGQAPQHLKSFYWEIQHCEEFGPPGAGGALGPSVKKSGAPAVGDMIDGAPNEPGIAMMGSPANKICKDAVNSEISPSYANPNRGKFSMGC